MSKKKETKLGPFKFFGMEFHDEGSDKENIIGTCLFCGKENHAYVNQYTGNWDCKRCGEAGTLERFIGKIYDDLLRQTSDSDLVRLADYRKLPFQALKNWKVACKNQIYFFPVETFDGRISNLGIYEIGKKVRSLPDCDLGLYGLPQLVNLDRRTEDIIICEGPFDMIAYDWILRNNSMKGICVAVPGANTFKTDWVGFFSNRNVLTVLDNDGAGEIGTEKIHKMLEPVIKKHWAYKWPVDAPPGCDMNDIISIAYTTNKAIEMYHTHILARLVDFKVFKDKSPTPIDPKASYGTFKIDKSLPPPGVITIPDMIKQYERVIDLNADLIKVIRLCLAVTLSIKTPGPDPAWLFLVGPPGFGKTLILTSFKNAPDFTYYQSSLRSTSMISGMPNMDGNDPSLLPKLHNRTLVLKDYTEVLGKNKDERDEIFNILRGAFDGSVERDFGNRVLRRYDPLRFSMLAGVTNEIQNHSQASIGERFMRFKLNTEGIDFDKQQEAAMFNALRADDAKEELQNAVNVFLSQEWDFSLKHIESLIPDWLPKKIAPLTRLTEWLRTPVVRHNFGINRGEIVYEPEAAAGNRLSVQFQRLAISLAIVERKMKIDESIYRDLQRIAMDTVFGYSTRVVQVIHNLGVPVSHETIAGKTGLGSVYNYLENLAMLKIIEESYSTVDGKKIKLYNLTGKVKDLWKRADL